MLPFTPQLLLRRKPPLISGATGTTLDPANKSSNVTLSGGNLIATSTVDGGSPEDARCTVTVSTGKKYCEFTATTMIAGSGMFVGLVDSSYVFGSTGLTNAHNLAYANDASVWINGSTPGNATAFVQGDIIGMELDVDAKLVSLYLNGSSVDPNIDISTIGSTLSPACMANKNGCVWTANFLGTGGTPYSRTPNVGFGNW